MSFKIGIDVGGTFTDLSLYEQGGTLETFKTLSTPEDPSIGVLDGLSLIAQSRGLDVKELAAATDTIVHGTTVTTNAVLTRGGAECGLLTTEGVRDALEMRRGVRERQYDNRYENVVPLVPRRRRLGVKGRIGPDGGELEPLDAGGLASAIERLRQDGVEAVAICFMNAFANPAHERQAAELVAAAMPGSHVSVSSQVLPAIRFYDRVSTTALDAYVAPVLKRYLASLTRRLEEVGFGGVLLIMQSNGGVALPSIIAERPATTLLSGPAAGPRAAATYASIIGRKDCTVVDMGGTSFDASLVQGGAATLGKEGEIERLRIGLPMLDITTIGAGGGSIGWIDPGGLLRMGPQSAGALPGPACYGRGGERPTCTDADLVLGYLDPEGFAGGKLRLDVERARSAIERDIAAPLSLDVEQAAAGMYRVICANMAHGVREITIKRGLDPRELPMVIAGGAGPLHACAIAAELGIRTLLVPPTASVLCSTGMLLCDLQHDFVRSRVGPLDAIDPDELRALVSELKAEGERMLRAEGAADIAHQVAYDLRYLKQYHEVTVPIVEGEAVADTFHAEHDRLYGYHIDGAPLELINVRVRSVGHTDKPPLPLLEAGDGDAGRASKGRRRAYAPSRDASVEVPVFDGHKLLAGDSFDGPALIERRDTTILVTAGFGARVDEHGSIVLEARS